MTPATQGKRRSTIGLLLDNLFDSYEEGFRRAIMQEAEALDVNLVCFRGGGGRAQRGGKELYELAGPENVDGIIAISACIDLGEADRTPGFSKDGALEALLGSYGALPVVSVGKSIPGVPSLLIENGSGVKELLEHFITAHGLQKIAYIRGPTRNEEADARFEAYRATLEKHHLKYDPERVFEGDFSAESGIRAVKAFLDERKVELDALVAANDYMVIDAMRECQRRGLRTPGNVAIGGFDDVRHAISTRPSLTTVRQPLRDMARAAVEAVLAGLQGAKGAPVTRFPTELVIRRSCGCMIGSGEVKAGQGLPAEPAASTPAEARVALAHRLDILFPSIGDRLRNGGWSGELSNTLLDELERKPDARFLATFERMASHGIEVGVTSPDWQKVVRSFFDVARRQTPNHAWERLGMLRERCMLLVGDLVEQHQVDVNIKMEGEAESLQRIFGPTGVDDEDIGASLEGTLPRMGITSLYLMQEDQDAAGAASLEYHFSFDDQVTLDAASKVCPAKRLVPGSFTQSHRYDAVVAPVNSGSAHLQYAVFSVRETSGTAIELLANQLGRALRAKRQVRAVKQRLAELEAKQDKGTR